MSQRTFPVLALSLAACAAAPAGRSAPAAGPATVCVRLVDGTEHEGVLQDESLRVQVGADLRVLLPQEVRSLHRAAAASEHEAQVLAHGMQALAATSGKEVESATEALVDLGLPVLTPLLDSYQDTDAHEPDPRYRLFARILPVGADAQDRTLDLVRLVDGTTLRGRVVAADLHLRTADGVSVAVPFAAIRRVAVRQSVAVRNLELQALHDCTYVSFVDTGLVVTPASSLRADASGFVRLSYAEDGWATGPDGLFETLPGKRKMQEGFRWGAVLGRVGAGGERWLIGSHCERAGLGDGHLYCVINDNEHWQNNIGSYRVQLRVTDAYDVSDAR